MFSNTQHSAGLLVTAICCLFAAGAAIRVDWGTNKGPIVPPTPRTTVAPKRPYREPAPVWEDQSDDIPNPNPYVYILPPPSRPRPAENNYATFDGRPWVAPLSPAPSAPTPVNHNSNNNNNNNNNQYNSQRHTFNAWQSPNTSSNKGSSTLAAKYVPNVGIKYLVVLTPSDASAVSSNGAAGAYYANVAAGLPTEKLHGKYNAKTKKYKVYEKVKSPVQFNYYMPMFELELPAPVPYNAVFDQDALVSTQQLPLPQAPGNFRSGEAHEPAQPQQHEQQQQQKYQHQWTTTSTPRTTTTAKHRTNNGNTLDNTQYGKSKRS